MSLIPEDTSKNYSTLRDALAAALATKLTPQPAKPRRRRRKVASEPEPDPAPGPEEAGAELAEFTEYIASETFECLGPELQSLTHTTWESIRDKYDLPLAAHDAEELLRGLDPGVDESLRTYTSRPAAAFLAPVLTTYLTAAATPPPPFRTTKGEASGCELCARDWVALSFHHLIPREVGDKAVRRGWHRREDLGRGAWLCHACHGFVHEFRGNEELARGYFSVERLLAEEEVRRWAGWVGRLRGSRR